MRKDLPVINVAGKRADIQGLRALAVIAVVLYHAGYFPNSGFIGVDIFFVISGFVISKLLITEFDENGRINFIRFYLRRLLRLLPALGFMITVSAVLAFFLISPLGMQQNSAKTGIGALFISANWVMAKVTQGYFDLPAETNIFLHTWSLSVEEQFYLFFPLALFIIIFARKLIRKRIGFSIPLTLIFFFSLLAYLGLFQLNILNSSTWLNGFYSPFTRTWEFLLGGLAFLLSRSVKTKRLFAHNATNLLAAMILLGSVFAPESLFKYPSSFLLIPLGSTFVLLFTGSYSNDKNRSIFDNQYLTYIGDRSYSIYLWHWPAIMLSRYIFPDNMFALSIALLIGIGISFLTYSKIENPIRKSDYQNRSTLVKTWIAFFLSPLILCLSLGYVASEISFKKYESGKIPGRYQGDIGAIGFDTFSSEYPAVCTIPSIPGGDVLDGCDADVGVIGDSHAQHLLPGFAHNFPELKFVGLDSNFLNFKSVTGYDTRLALLNKNRNIKIVVINAYWAPNSVPQDLRLLVRSLTNSGKKVIVLDDVPNFPFDSFTCKYGISTFINHINCEMSSRKFIAQRDHYFPSLIDSTKGNLHAELIQTSNLFCTKRKCSMVKNGELNYLDLNHLNVNGSKYVTRSVARKSSFFCSTFIAKFSNSSICSKY